MLVPPVVEAVKLVIWPSVVGLLPLSVSPVIGASLTVTWTVSRILTMPRPSVTFRAKVSTAGVAGAVKVGWAVLAPVSVTAGVPICVHW